MTLEMSTIDNNRIRTLTRPRTPVRLIFKSEIFPLPEAPGAPLRADAADGPPTTRVSP
jgi:hypothetical protein